ncbi:23S rRNA (adenine(2030)-N(6))-methyltransferase RlmJ [Opitutaceae bacterium TAV3]|nr:23S rRNA (adenine(2030)-N(6))-methyltransferase RlmJ [Opitutaceae bacterium TAV3]
MNYRHQFHAGNFADVFKHAILVQLVRFLQRKEKGILYLDTHAGRGRYQLAAAARGDSLERQPEWPEGIGRLLASSPSANTTATLPPPPPPPPSRLRRARGLSANYQNLRGRSSGNLPGLAMDRKSPCPPARSTGLVRKTPG